MNKEHWDALDALLKIPAPDLPALHDKLRALHQNDPTDAWDTLGEDIALIAKDAERLIGGDPHKAEDWLANLAAFRNVEDEQRRYYVRKDFSDQIGGPLFERFARALDRVLLTPAPDFPALAEKLAIYDANEIDDGWNLSREMTTLLAQDAARLTWQAALAPFEQATAALEDCEEDEEIDVGADAQLTAMVPLLLTPAPNGAALTRKLDIIRSESAWSLNQGNLIMDSLAEDVRRLTKAA